jgi:protein TonB
MACILNFLIFYLIQHMVSREQNITINQEIINLTDFIRLDRKPEKTKQDEIDEDINEPPPPEETPPPELIQPEISKPAPVQTELPMPDFHVPLSIRGTPFLGDFLKSPKPKPKVKPGRPAIDTNVVPTIKIPPVYPPRALRMGIEGVVTVEFTITTDGSVKDPEIVKATPPRIFDRAVLQAIHKWKFNPEIIDGKAIEKRARQDILFSLKK